jgi:hypothetical protein
MGPTILAVVLVQLSGPDGQWIDVNPREVVSVREPRVAEHFAPGIKCLLHMTDGKIITVVEDCETVRGKLTEEGRE